MYVTYRNMYMTYIRIAYHRFIMCQNIKFVTALVRIVHHLHVDIHSATSIKSIEYFLQEHTNMLTAKFLDTFFGNRRRTLYITGQDSSVCIQTPISGLSKTTLDATCKARINKTFGHSIHPLLHTLCLLLQ